MDDVGDVTFELRRRLTTITTECDVLLTENQDDLSPEVTESIQRIDDQVRQLVTLVSRLETAPVSDQPIRALEADHSPHEPTPNELIPEGQLLLSLPTGPFADQVLTELESANRPARLLSDPSTAIPDRDVSKPDSYLVLSVQDILQYSPSTVDAAVSLITPPQASEPILGVSGMLAPDVSEQTLTDVLDAFHDPDAPTAPVAMVRPESSAPESPLTSRLSSAGRPIHTLTTEETVPSDVECILAPPEVLTDDELARLRHPQDGRRTPVVIITEPPSGDWLPTVGGRTFVQRPPTAADFVGELLLLLDS